MRVNLKCGGYREEGGIVLADGFYIPYRFLKCTHQLKGAKGVSGMFDMTGEGTKFVEDIKNGKYDIKEPYRPFQDAGYVEDNGKPTEKQSELFNKYCHTKNLNYYDGEDSLELLFEHAIPRLKRDFSPRQLGLGGCGIEEWRSWHPDQPAKWLFRDIWWTLKLFYEKPKHFWQRM